MSTTPKRIYLYTGRGRGAKHPFTLGTFDDLKAAGIEPSPGLCLTFYSDDADDEGRPSNLVYEGVVGLDEESGRWYAIVDWESFRYEPRRYDDEPHGYEIIEQTKSKSELEHFAAWFHQDWKLVFKNFHEGAAMYFQSLTPERKLVLHQELVAFLEAHRDDSLEDLKRAWLKCGAQGWQASLNIRDTLNEFAQVLGQ